MKPIASLLFLLAAFLPLSHAQRTIASNEPVKSLITKGFDKMYNSEFAAAANYYEQFHRAMPNSPVYSLVKGLNSYWQWYPAQTDDKMIAQGLQLFQTASDQSTAILKKNKSDLDAMYVYISAEGMLSRIYLMQNENLESAKHAKNSFFYLDEARQNVGVYPDFIFAIGMYNYWRDKFAEMHPFWKSFLFFLEDGDKKLGISQIESAYRNSVFTKVESILYLTLIYYQYENTPALALPFMKKLSAQYPANLFFKAKYAEGLVATRQLELAQPQINQLLASNQPVYLLAGNTLQAQVWEQKGDWASAQKCVTTGLSYVKSGYGANENYEGLLYMILGHIARKNKLGSEAQKYYAQVEEVGIYPAMVSEARYYRKELKAKK